MVQNSKVQNRTFPIRLNTVLYIAFSLSGIIIWLTNKDISTAVANFGIALAFDPFNQNVKWQDRHAYQKVILISHVLILFSSFIYMATFNK